MIPDGPNIFSLRDHNKFRIALNELRCIWRLTVFVLTDSSDNELIRIEFTKQLRFKVRLVLERFKENKSGMRVETSLETTKALSLVP